MACPLCGEHCTCSHGDERAKSMAAPDCGPHVAVLIDPESFDLSEQQFAASLDEAAPLNDTELRPPSDASYPAADTVWRNEVSSRVDAYRARRGRPRRAEASLSLDFEQPVAPPPVYEERPRPQLQVVETPKIIEFPRPAEPAPPPMPYVEELAEPIVERPRILEAAPDEAPPLFGGVSLAPITLEEPAPSSEPMYEEELLPLDVAPRALRVVAGMTDLVVVVLATALFALIFFQMTDATPAGKLAKLMAILVPGLLWSFYHYIFLVHAAATPGMQLTGLHLSTFDGEPVPAATRRWRALALVMSCASVGLGFLWAAMDEDALCWHDRVTGTYLRQA